LEANLAKSFIGIKIPTPDSFFNSYNLNISMTKMKKRKVSPVHLIDRADAASMVELVKNRNL
jgi:hypothetical protein